MGNEVSKTFIDANGNPTKTMIPKEQGNTINTVVCQTNCLTYYREMSDGYTFVGYYLYDENGKEVYSHYNSGVDNQLRHEEDPGRWLDEITISAGDYNNYVVQIYIDGNRMYIWEWQSKDGNAKNVVLKDGAGNISVNHQVAAGDRIVDRVGWNDSLGCFVVYEELAQGEGYHTVGITLYRPNGSVFASMSTKEAGHSIQLAWTGDGTVFLEEVDENYQPVRKQTLN